MAKKLGNRGSGLVSILLAVIVVAAIGFAGWAVWHHGHRTKTAATNSIGQSKTQPSDPYAGWKTYCDNVYGYCFRYPSNWTLNASTIPQAGANLISPLQTVQVVYSNPYTIDSRLDGFEPTTIEKINNTNQDLTLLGGYIPSSGSNGIAGNNIPYYRVIDSSLLNTYPLHTGQLGEFPDTPRFSDKKSNYYGALIAVPAVTIQTTSQSREWLNSQDALISVKILESLYYKG